MYNKIGIIGLGVMGRSIALNINAHGYKISVYNKTYQKTEMLMQQYPEISGYQALREFVDSLEKPRKILLMVSANGVDAVLNKLLDLLDKEDIVIDGGNSFYLDSEKRMKRCEEKGIYYIGMGISGGEEGALKGPSLMPSGNIYAYQQIKEILTNIAAKNDEGDACVSYIGSGGSGHFVKMVHNGIEYAQMQLIAETYMTLIKANQSEAMIADVFDEWNQGELKSYLLEITSTILRYQDEKGDLLFDKIKDVAHHKGTGSWTSLSAIEYNEAIPSITAALQARFLSQKRKLTQPSEGSFSVSSDFIDHLKKSFYITKAIIYHQGFELMRKVSDEKNWNLNYSEIARIWQKGCIIQSSFLKEIIRIYQHGQSILEDPFISTYLNQNQNEWRGVLQMMIQHSIYAPVYLSSLTYYDGLRERMGMNLIQAQRDYFGAHTYERTDREGVFHTDWKRN